MAEEIIDDIFTGDPQPRVPKLKEEHRVRLDSIVQRMTTNKESDSNIRAVVNDFKQKYSVAENQKQPAFTPMSDWLDVSAKGYQPIMTDAVVDNSHFKNTNEAAERINRALAEIDPHINNLLRDTKKEMHGRIKSQVLGVNPTEARQLNPQAAQIESSLREDPNVDPVEVENYKIEMVGNVEMVRNALKRQVEDLGKTDTERANQIKADVYRLDRQNNEQKESKIAKNVQKLKEGAYDYDVKRGALVKPEGFFGSLVTGFKQKNQLFKDYEFYKNTDNDGAIIKELNTKIKDIDPDEAVPVPEGSLGEAGAMLGGQPIKPIVGGVISGVLTTPVGGAVGGGAIASHEMYKLGYAAALPQNYAAIKREHPDMPDFEAYTQAKELSEKQAMTDAVSGGAMGLLGARMGLKPTGVTAAFQKSLASGLKQLGKAGVEKGIEGLAGGVAGAGGQVVKNLMAQRAGLPVDTEEGIAEQLVAGVGMTMGIALLSKFHKLLKPSTYNKLVNEVAKMPDEAISQEASALQESDLITAEEIGRLQSAIRAQRELDRSIPSEVPESDRVRVQEKIKKRNELETKMEEADKAFHPELKEKIKSLNEEIVNISKGGERGELQKLVAKAEIEGATADVLKNASEKELNGYFKDIAEQANDPRTEQLTIDTFGEEIVNKAKELFPAPEVAESAVSVIMPGEIKQREAITIKPKEDAIQIESPVEMDVRQQAGDGESVATGDAQREIAAREEVAVPVEEGVGASQEGVGGLPPVIGEGKGVYVERPETQLSFRGLQDTANEFGYDDVRTRDSVSDIQEMKNAENTTNEWAANGEYQKNVDDMLSRIEAKEMVPTAKQRLILQQYLANEKEKARGLKGTSEYDAQLAKVKRIVDIGLIARQEAGAALRIPEGGSLPHPINDEVDAMAAKMEANKVDVLTDQQKAEVEAQVEEYRKRSEVADARVAELEAKVAEIDSKKEFNKVKSITKRTKKTAQERVAYRRSEVEAAREALKKLRTGESGLSSVPLPGVRELMAIAPHVKNIMVDLVAQGVDNLEDVVKHLHGEFKEVLDGITEKNIHDIIAGVYNEKAKPLSELQRQVKDIQDESKLINQLEALLNGKEPKAEKAKRERNQKIKSLKDKIKDFRKEETESNKFYGESEVGERKLDALRDELDRIQYRRQKEKPAKDSQADKEISGREKELRDQIEKAQAEWDKEKDSATQAKRDYERMEAERNRQLQKVDQLKEKLNNLQKGVKTKGKPQQKKQDTPEIEALKKQVSDAEKELNNTLSTEKRIKGLEEELDRLKQRKDKESKEVETREITDRERELKEQINEERKAFKKEQSESDTFYKEELDEDAKKLIAIKKRNQKREQEIKAKIAAGQFEKETKTSIFDREDVKKNYPRLRKDALDAIAKKEEAQHEFDLALYEDEMAQRSKVRKFFGALAKVVHTSKAVMSGIDDSATFVQNGLAMLANPKMGAKVWLNHWKDAFSDARFKRELSAIHQRPDWEIIKNSGLDIVEPHSAASKQVEEAFEQNLLAGKVKIGGKDFQPWKYTGGIFERAFTSMGNNMRLALFEKQAAELKEAGKTFESHPKEYKDAARVINELTGRGKLPEGIAEKSQWITPFIWAPRMLASTINTLGLGEVMALGGKGYYQNLTPTQRKFALSQLRRGVGMGVAVMVAAALGGATVDYDPRSVTFGDVIIGDHHYNVFGRYTPVVKALVQYAWGERVKKDGVQDLDSGKRGAKTRMGVVGGFFRGKMTPFAGAIYDLSEHKNYFTNQPFGIKDFPAALLTPMSAKELVEGWKNDGTWTLLNRFLPAFEGLKVSDERDFKKTESSGSKNSVRKSPRGNRNKNINIHKHTH